MATPGKDLEPDFLRWMAPAARRRQGDGEWHGQNMGWPSRNTAQPKTIIDDDGRMTRIRTPVMDLEGLTTPTHLFYVVQHFAVPDPVPEQDWRLTSMAAVKPVGITYEDLRRFPGRTVRTVMECSGSDATISNISKDGPEAFAERGSDDSQCRGIHRRTSRCRPERAGIGPRGGPRAR